MTAFIESINSKMSNMIRIFRLMRLAKLTRYNDSLRVIVRTFSKSAKDFMFLIILFVMAAVGFGSVRLFIELLTSKITSISCQTIIYDLSK